MSGLASEIYRYIFSMSQTDFMINAKTMVEDVNIISNMMAVNSVTEIVVMNSIKEW